MQVPVNDGRKYYLRANPNIDSSGDATLELVGQNFIEDVSTGT